MSRVIANSNLTGVKSLTLDITDRDHDYPVRLLGINAYSREIMTSVGSVSVDENMPVDVYNLQGIKIRENVKAQNALNGLPRGIYIVGGKKIIR